MFQKLFLVENFITGGGERYQFYHYHGPETLSIYEAMRLVNTMNGKLPSLATGGDRPPQESCGRVAIVTAIETSRLNVNPDSLLMIRFLHRMEQILAIPSVDSRSLEIYDLVKEMCVFKLFKEYVKDTAEAMILDKVDSLWDIIVFNDQGIQQNETAYNHLFMAVVWLCITYGFDTYRRCEKWIKSGVQCTMKFEFAGDCECTCSDELKKEAKTIKRGDPLWKITTLSFIDRCCCANRCKSKRLLLKRMGNNGERAGFIDIYSDVANQRKMLGLIHTGLPTEPYDVVYISSSDPDDDEASAVYIPGSDDEDGGRAPVGTKRRLPREAT